MMFPVCIHIKRKTGNDGVTIMADSGKFFTFIVFFQEKMCVFDSEN